MRHIIFSILLLTVLTACGLPRATDRSKSPTTAQYSRPSTEPTETRQRPPAETRQELHALLQNQDYPKALLLISREMHRGLSERYLADDYALAINGCLQQATALLARQEPARAGQLFASARDNYPGSRALTARVSLTPTQLDEQIETCAEKLMAQGLATYRSGELDKAIRIWEQILTFAPQHEAARNAVRITELQLANLKVIESAPTAR